MIYIAGLIIGIFIGVIFGIIVVALCVSAGRADEKDCERCP